MQLVDVELENFQASADVEAVCHELLFMAHFVLGGVLNSNLCEEINHWCTLRGLICAAILRRFVASCA